MTGANASWPAAAFNRGLIANLLQSVLLVGAVLLFVSPFPVPDPLRLGPQLSWAAIGLAASAPICLGELFAGRFPATRLDRVLALYLVLVGVSALANVDGRATLEALILLVAEIGLFYGASAAASRAPQLTTQILIVLIAGAAVVELIAFGYHLEVGLGARPTEYVVPAGWSGYPELGALGALQFGVLAGAFVGASGTLQRFAAGVLLLGSATEILFLFSRTAWTAAAAIGVVTLPFAGRHWKRLLPAAGAIVLVVGWLAAGNQTIQFLTSNAFMGTRGGPRPDVHAAPPSFRVQLWQRTGRMIADHPWLGVGPGSFRVVFESQYNPELNQDQRRGVHAHNLWLQVTAEAGLPAGLCYLAIWGAVLWTAGRTAWRDRSAVNLAVFFAIVGATASNLTDAVPAQVAGTRVFLLTWTLFGLAAAADSRQRSSQPTARSRGSRGPD